MWHLITATRAYRMTSLVQSSGVARLGHTGVRVLGSRGRAPSVQVCMQIIGADSTVVDRKSGARDKVENLLTQVGVRKSCISTDYVRVSILTRALRKSVALPLIRL